MIGDKVVLLLTGDIVLGCEFVKFKERRNVGWEYPFDGVKSVFEKADIVFGNLEGPLSNVGQIKAGKNAALYSPPESVRALKYLGYDVLNLGNNHITDYGEPALAKTIEILQEQGISHFGAGRNLAEAEQPAYVEKRGLRLAFLGYTSNEHDPNSVIAGSNRAGCVFYDPQTIARQIAAARSNADIICISLHWGIGSQAYPSPGHIVLAHKIIDAGADIVIGTHPHLIQGFERYKQGVVFYGLGNFFLPDYRDRSGDLITWPKASNEFFIARCEVSKSGLGEVGILPGFRNQEQKVVLLSGEERARATAAIDNLSSPIARTDYQSFWDKYQLVMQRNGLKELVQRAKALGPMGCIRSISATSIKGTAITILRYLRSFRPWI